MNRFLYSLIICLISTNLYSQTRDEFVPFSEVREDVVSEVDVASVIVFPLTICLR